MNILRDRTQLIEHVCASLLCAAAEREWLRAAGTHSITAKKSPRVENARRGLRVAGMLATHYNLLPEPEPEEYDDGTDDTTA